jgi:hypothetical protein
MRPAVLTSARADRRVEWRTACHPADVRKGLGRSTKDVWTSDNSSRVVTLNNFWENHVQKTLSGRPRVHTKVRVGCLPTDVWTSDNSGRVVTLNNFWENHVQKTLSERPRVRTKVRVDRLPMGGLVLQ